MTDPRQTTTFAGATHAGDAPDWYGTAETTLDGALADLPEAVSRTLGYVDDETNEWVADSRFAVLVNPDWEGDGLPADGPNTAAWYPVTTAYDPVTPRAAYAPLADALADADGETFGQIRQYRFGGEVHMDVFSSAFTVDLPDGADRDLNSDGGDQATLDGDTTQSQEWILGLQVGHDYFQQTALYARVIALDPLTGTVHRGLSERRKRTHRKARDDETGETADELAAWWELELDRMDDVGDAIYSVVYDATQYDIPMDALPFDAADFMAAGGFPDSLADQAASRLPGKGAGQTYSAWSLHVAMSDALTQHFDGKTDGTAERRHVRLANRWLFAPYNAEHEALDALADETTEQTGLSEFEDGEPTDPFELRKKLRDRRDSLAAKVDTHRNMAARLRSMLAAAKDDQDDSDDEQPATDGADTDETATA